MCERPLHSGLLHITMLVHPHFAHQMSGAGTGPTSRLSCTSPRTAASHLPPKGHPPACLSPGASAAIPLRRLGLGVSHLHSTNSLWAQHHQLCTPTSLQHKFHRLRRFDFSRSGTRFGCSIPLLLQVGVGLQVTLWLGAERIVVVGNFQCPFHSLPFRARDLDVHFSWPLDMHPKLAWQAHPSQCARTCCACATRTSSVCEQCRNACAEQCMQSTHQQCMRSTH